VKNSEF